LGDYDITEKSLSWHKTTITHSPLSGGRHVFSGVVLYIRSLLNKILGLFILVQERGNIPHVVSKNIRKQYNWF
jgi:hypothetical protein